MNTTHQIFGTSSELYETLCKWFLRKGKSMKFWLRQITVITCVWNLTGCNFHQQIADDALAYNQTVETVSNQQLLLNIIRSKERRPMHFTALTQIRGSLSGSVTASGIFPFGGDADSKYPITTGGTYSSKPSFDMAILDSQKFMQGIMEPIEMELLKYYWDQGWPPELLLYLFVRKVEWDDGDTTKQIVNYPANAKDFFKFRMFAKLFSQATFVEDKKPGDNYGPSLDLSVRNLKKQIEAQKGEYTLGEENGEYFLRKPTSTFVLEINDESLWVPNDLFPETDKRSKGVNGVIVSRTKFETMWSTHFDKLLGKKHDVVLLPDIKQFSDIKYDQTDDDDTDGADNNRVEKPGRIYLRSPEAVLYYLGELSREIIMKGKDFHIPSIVPSDKKKQTAYDYEWPIFYLETGKGSADDALVSIVYDHNSFAIPEKSARPQDDEVTKNVDNEDKQTPNNAGYKEAPYGPGRSMHCLSLLTQILALHKSSDELPTTETVTIVGQ